MKIQQQQWISLQPGDVQFFAASTLHAKISKQWEEVPNTEYLGLQTRILEVLKNPGTSKLALSRLCQAVNKNKLSLSLNFIHFKNSINF